MIEVRYFHSPISSSWFAKYRIAGDTQIRATWCHYSADAAMKAAWRQIGFDKPVLIFPRSAK